MDLFYREKRVVVGQKETKSKKDKGRRDIEIKWIKIEIRGVILNFKFQFFNVFFKFKNKFNENQEINKKSFKVFIEFSLNKRSEKSSN